MVRRSPARATRGRFATAVATTTAVGVTLLGCGDDGSSESSTRSSASSTTSGAGASGGGGQGASGAQGGGGEGTPCEACGDPTSTGNVVDPAIAEASGIVASRTHEGIYWVHNDSGDSPRFFAVTATGESMGTFDVTGATAVDWEDMAIGPCPSGSCLFFADVGDNTESRVSYSLTRVTEPQDIGPGAHSVSGEVMSITYPDGSHNAETLLVHPETGELFVVQKREDGPSGVYSLAAFEPGGAAVLERRGELTVPEGSRLVTGGDVHPAARGVLLRTYTHLFYFDAPAGDVPAALATAPCAVPVAIELQGESVAWTAGGDGYLTLSEGTNKPLNAVHCGP
jgi:hypothetical protein